VHLSGRRIATFRARSEPDTNKPVEPVGMPRAPAENSNWPACASSSNGAASRLMPHPLEQQAGFSNPDTLHWAGLAIDRDRTRSGWGRI